MLGAAGNTGVVWGKEILYFGHATAGAAVQNGFMFSPSRVVGLVIWVYLCIYLAIQAKNSPLVSNRYRQITAVFSLFIGPMIFFVLIVADVTRKLHEKTITSGDILKYVFGSNFRIKGRVDSEKAVDADFIELTDSAGKNFAEVYKRQGSEEWPDEVIELTKKIVLSAIRDGASDILIDPKSDNLYSVRVRVDGVLRTVGQVEAGRCNAIINSIKALSAMDIAEKRRPQDGSFMAKIPEGNVYFRVASSGVLGGEKLSLRLLNQTAGMLKIEQIGLSENSMRVIRQVAGQSCGTALICGPTGSGKTTTLYAILQEIDVYTRNVITVEDPIEYMVNAASQIEVNVKAGITFANALRSILRQDPDVICVGEIRDSETAGMALQASQTGHLVLATLHASSNVAALVRLMDLGIKPLLLASAVSVIISQRLVRRLCEDCKRPARPSEEQRRDYTARGINPDTVMEAAGCDMCFGTGFRGRTAIVDILFLDDKIKAAIADKRLSAGQLKQKGDDVGRSNLIKEGYRKVSAGLTTVEEVNRVTSTLGG